MTSVNKNRKSRDENAMAKYNDKELAETSKFLRENNTMLHKPPCRQIEKQARTFVAYPAPGI